MSQFNPPVLLVSEGQQEKAVAFYSAVFPEWKTPAQVIANAKPEDPVQWQLLSLSQYGPLPWQDGSPTWVEIMTDLGVEESTARAAVSGTPWRLAEGLPFPIENAPPGTTGEYITILDGSGSLENKAKLMGVLPAQALLSEELVAKLHLPMTFVYFGAASEDDLRAKFAAAKAAGATPVKEPFEGDGLAAILIDPLGAMFGLYFPTFDPDGIKATTKLQSPWKTLALGTVTGD